MIFLSCFTATPQCKSPGIPAYGVKIGNSYTIGATVTFQCRPGYRLVGVSSILCGDDQEWSANRPTCEPRMDFKRNYSLTHSPENPNNSMF